jgi:hypothetical protein
MRITKQLGWKALTYGTGAVTTLVTRQVLEAIWRRTHAEPPPDDPANLRSPWPQAAIWAIATGAGVGVARFLALRSAARVWEVATHEMPPGYEAA